LNLAEPLGNAKRARRVLGALVDIGRELFNEINLGPQFAPDFIANSQLVAQF
jgi:hypothetical protein